MIVMLHRTTSALVFVAAVFLWAGTAFAQQPQELATTHRGALAGERHRVLVSTDIGGTDPDDFQSMVRLLLYADVLDIEGLVSSPYEIQSNAPGLDGKTGAITSYAPPPSVALNPSARFPNWWTDDPSPAMAEGIHHGAKTVSQWREDYLHDFAARMERCKSPAASN
jgi:hypothetical protein